MKIFTNFTPLADEGLSRRSLQIVRRELRNVERALRYFDAHVDAALGDARLSQRSKHFLRAQWYGDPGAGPLSLANRAVRRATMIASITTLLLHAQAEPSARRLRRRFRMLTTTADLGITNFDKPVLKLSAVGRQFVAAARKAGVDAIGFLDVAVVDQKLTLEPLKIAFHMHGAMRARNNTFRTESAERTAAPARQPTNECGLKVVRIKSRKKDWGAPLTRANVARLGYYCAKLTCGIDAVFTKWKKRRTKTTLHGWKLVHALRQVECHSHCDALETTRGVGQLGTALRRRWKDVTLRLLGIAGSARGQKIDHRRLEQQWAAVWAELGEHSMRAVRVI